MAEEQTFTFEAEVRQLLDLVIHSLYSDREIFLRELISNASDALDRVRVMGLSRSDLRAAEGEVGIRVSFDADAKTITISDTGVGLTTEQAREHLGTIARSGTKAFAQAIAEQGEAGEHNLIGQFGVGFYSALMVADEVVVESLSAEPDAEPIRWRCDGSTSYELSAGERTSRGTDVVLHLREDAEEFLEAFRLKEIVRKHSEYIGYPIWMDEEQLNEPKALWTRSPEEIEDDEYKEFYKHLSKDWAEPATWMHAQVDAPIQYRSILFVPSQKPFDLNWPDGKRPVRLYARRVLILEEARDLLPDYLRFVRGVVDSEDIQLNASREMVQKTPVVETIKKQLTSKVLKHLKKWASDEPEAYADFWRDFGPTLKEGAYNDAGRKKKLLPLLRFNTTRHDDDQGLISIAEYNEAMPEDQDAIWYLTAPDRETAIRSPLLEAFQRKGWEVLLLTDAVDEWAIQALNEIDGKPLKSVSRGEIDLDDEDEVAEDEGEQSETVGWLQQLLSGQVKDVRSSKRLTRSASVLVDDEFGMSANMQRILRDARQDVPGSMRVLEINPDHTMVKTAEALRDQGRYAEAEVVGRLLLDRAQLVEGEIADPAGVVARLDSLSALISQALSGEPPEVPVEVIEG